MVLDGGTAMDRVQDGDPVTGVLLGDVPHRASARRWLRRAGLVLTGVFLLLWLAELGRYFGQPDRSLLGVDYDLYMEATNRWLAGGPFYEPYQLAGAYPITYGDILYPPTALPLFVVFTFLPPVLWWVIPIAGILATLVYYRPSPLALAAIAVCLAVPATWIKVLTGNPVMFAALAVALGTRWAVAAPWALIKPSLFPFALVGIRNGAWWLSLLVMMGLAVALWPLMVDWFTAIRNGIGSGGILYSVQEAPLMAIPVIAWLGSTRRGQPERT